MKYELLNEFSLYLYWVYYRPRHILHCLGSSTREVECIDQQKLILFKLQFLSLKILNVNKFDGGKSGHLDKRLVAGKERSQVNLS